MMEHDSAVPGRGIITNSLAKVDRADAYVLLISNYQHLAADGGPISAREQVLRGSVERLSPILMTAATTALAILPLVVSGNLPGHEIEHPMAVVITGGLLSSTSSSRASVGLANCCRTETPIRCVSAIGPLG